MRRTLPLAALICAGGLLLAGCSTPNPSPSGSTDRPSQSTTAPDTEEPAANFDDAWGGTGQPWSIGAECPEPSQIADLMGVPALDTNGTDTTTGCRYFDTSIPAGMNIYSMDRAQFDANEWPTAIPKTNAPSLGDRAFTATDESIGACSLYVPRSDQTDTLLIVTAVSKKAADERCTDAVNVLKSVAVQG